MLLLLLGVALAGDLSEEIRHFVPDPATADALVARVRREEAALAEGTGLSGFIVSNLADKRLSEALAGVDFELTTDEIDRTIIGYETFKLSAYVSSGVFPKRYFGYLDNRWDTAEREQA